LIVLGLLLQFRRLRLLLRLSVSMRQCAELQTLYEEGSDHAKQAYVRSTITTPMAVLEQTIRGESLKRRGEQVNPRCSQYHADSKELERLNRK